MSSKLFKTNHLPLFGKTSPKQAPDIQKKDDFLTAPRPSRDSYHLGIRSNNLWIELDTTVLGLKSPLYQTCRKLFHADDPEHPRTLPLASYPKLSPPCSAWKEQMRGWKSTRVYQLTKSFFPCVQFHPPTASQSRSNGA